MSLFARRFEAPGESRAVTFQQVWGSAADLATPGSWTPHRALTVPAVAQVVGHLARNLASCELVQGREQADGQMVRMARSAVVRRPSEVLTLRDWLHVGVVDLLTHGNAIGVRTGQRCEWLPAREVTATGSWFQPGSVRYHWKGQTFGRSEVMHWRHFPTSQHDRIMSPSVLDAVRAVWEASGYNVEFLRAFFASGGHPTGLLLSDQAIDGKMAGDMKDRFLAAIGRRRGVAAMGSGIRYESVQATVEDAQVEAVARLTKQEIAALYGLAPESVAGASGGSMTYSNVLSLSERDKSFAFQPIARVIGDGMSELLPSPQLVHVDLDTLVVVSEAERIASGVAATGGPVKTLNEWRRKEGHPPVEGGDVMAGAQPALPGLGES